MKKQLYVMVITLLVIASSCKKDFLDIKPKGKVIPAVLIDYRRLLNNTNSLPKSYGLDEFATDNIEFYDAVGPIYLSAINTKLHTWQSDVYTLDDSDGEWNSLYNTIYVANVVLEGMKTVTDGSLAERNQVMGEALVHRAYSFWALVNQYAVTYDPATAATDLGVPLRLTTLANENLVRVSVQKVYDQIFADLNESLALLGATSTSNFEPRLAAAYGILARAYLSTGKYPEALDAAKKALAQNVKLEDYNTYIANINNLPRNAINPEILLAKIPYSAFLSCPLSNDLKAVFDQSPGDLRFKLFFNNATGVFGTAYYYWGDYLPPSVHNIGPTVGEMYLIKAEAEARGGDVAAALADLNTLRTKRIDPALYQPLTAQNASEALDKTLEERRRELCFKGLRLFDLKRLNKETRFQKTLTHVFKGQTYTLTPNSPNYLFPIALKVQYLNKEIAPNERQ